MRARLKPEPTVHLDMEVCCRVRWGTYAQEPDLSSPVPRTRALLLRAVLEPTALVTQATRETLAQEHVQRAQQASTNLQQEGLRHASNVPRASIPKHYRIFAPSVLWESMQRKTKAHHVLGVMHQAGMCVWLDHQVEGVSSAAHISCVPEANQAACPSPS